MIRKISIGVDYKNAMHYQVGQSFFDMTIDTIRQVDSGSFEIWVKTSKSEVILWKKVVGMPCIVEMDTKAFG